METVNQISLKLSLKETSPEQLKLAISHNKFGGLCLKAGAVDKAISHFQKALEAVVNLAFTNVYQNLGNAYAQKKDIETAVKYYNIVIEFSPYNPSNQEKTIDQYLYKELIKSKEAYIDAYTNLGN